MSLVALTNATTFESLDGKSILESARQQGTALEYSCRTGRCGVCKAKVIRGETEILQAEESLTAEDEAEGFILTCCRAAKTELELDIEDLGELGSIQIRTLPCRIDSLRFLSDDVVEVVLRTPPASRLVYLPGQYVDMIGKDGLRRSYSIANAPRDDGKITLQIRKVEQGKMSQFWFEEAKANDLLRMEGPLGTFCLRKKNASQLILLATGTGIAPVKAMLEQLATTPAANTYNHIHLYWGGRAEEDIYWRPDFESLPLTFTPVLSRTPDWQGRKGYLITSKYADGLPLYRQEQMLKRLGHEISRTNMAKWIIQLEPVFRPLMNLMREVQNSSDYLQADETRIQVLKEDGKAAQSDKWMWVTRGGPPDQPSVLFEYDPSRSGSVAVRLLDGFKGVLQADGYAGYEQICRENGITRIGCWDHARRKFMEAIKAAKPQGKGRQTKTSKADIALSHINKLYTIEREIKDLSHTERLRVRQELSLSRLDAFKSWLDGNLTKVMKGSLTRKAMEYTLNQWESLIGYCERGELQISNVLAENAIRPFAIGRKAWLFADTPQGARASATCYSLIETGKANNIEPSRYIQHLLTHIAQADMLEKLEALLPWNIRLQTSEACDEHR